MDLLSLVMEMPSILRFLGFSLQILFTAVVTEHVQLIGGGADDLTVLGAHILPHPG